MPYVNQRWLGGTLTNFATIRQRVKYLRDLEARKARGELALLPKKEMLSIEREIEKLNRRLGGIKNMDTLPDMLFVIDVRREDIAVKEANILDIPIVAMVDTNCDPTPIDLVIPSNDDAIRAIKLITGYIADAAAEGRMMREAAYVEELGEREDFRAVDTTRRVFSPTDEPDFYYEEYEDDEYEDYDIDDEYEDYDIDEDDEDYDIDEDDEDVEE
jgi:small subunit ribosomal protein S2